MRCLLYTSVRVTTATTSTATVPPTAITHSTKGAVHSGVDDGATTHNRQMNPDDGVDGKDCSDQITGSNMECDSFVPTDRILAGLSPSFWAHVPMNIHDILNLELIDGINYRFVVMAVGDKGSSVANTNTYASKGAPVCAGLPNRISAVDQDGDASSPQHTRIAIAEGGSGMKESTQQMHASPSARNPPKALHHAYTREHVCNEEAANEVEHEKHGFHGSHDTHTSDADKCNSQNEHGHPLEYAYRIVPVSKCSLVGFIVAVDIKPSGRVYVLDDGTGLIDCFHWLGAGHHQFRLPYLLRDQGDADPIDCNEQQSKLPFAVGDHVTIFGKIKNHCVVDRINEHAMSDVSESIPTGADEGSADDHDAWTRWDCGHGASIPSSVCIREIDIIQIEHTNVSNNYAEAAAYSIFGCAVNTSIDVNATIGPISLDEERAHWSSIEEQLESMSDSSTPLNGLEWLEWLGPRATEHVHNDQSQRKAK